DTLLALVPTYGAAFIFVAMVLSWIAVPIPAAILVMAAGGFAAAQDLVLWRLILAAFAGVVIGDQLSYALGKYAAPAINAHVAKRPTLARGVDQASALLQERGWIAIITTRTVLSPLGPFVGYLSGMAVVPWKTYTTAAIIGAALWASGFVSIGYMFTANIAQIAAILSSTLGAVLLAAVALTLIWWLVKKWRENHTP
ncbi:MAG: DedA family protein, partial [Pseudomonadota bacterium]